MRDIFDVAVAEGLLVKITDDIYLHATAGAELRRRVIEQLRTHGKGLTVAEIRDLLGTTRKYAVPFCEYLDRAGITRRQGDLRILVQDFVSTAE
jgi:selenocysteine-specific elongation factor